MASTLALLLIALPEDPLVLRVAADLMEGVKNAQDEYTNFIASHGGFLTNDEPVNPSVVAPIESLEEAGVLEPEAVVVPGPSNPAA